MEYSDDQIADYKTKMMDAVKKIMPKLGEAEFYVGESCNPDGMIALLEYREGPDGNETPIMIFFKQGLEEEKV